MGPPPTTPRAVEADAGTRTPDPFITSEVLYQLSYVGTTPGIVAPLRGRSFPRASLAPCLQQERAQVGVARIDQVSPSPASSVAMTVRISSLAAA
jgi:hypothetical protein